MAARRHENTSSEKSNWKASTLKTLCTNDLFVKICDLFLCNWVWPLGILRFAFGQALWWRLMFGALLLLAMRCVVYAHWRAGGWKKLGMAWKRSEENKGKIPIILVIFQWAWPRKETSLTFPIKPQVMMRLLMWPAWLLNKNYYMYDLWWNGLREQRSRAGGVTVVKCLPGMKP